MTSITIEGDRESIILQLADELGNGDLYIESDVQELAEVLASIAPHADQDAIEQALLDGYGINRHMSQLVDTHASTVIDIAWTHLQLDAEQTKAA